MLRGVGILPPGRCKKEWGFLVVRLDYKSLYETALFVTCLRAAVKYLFKSTDQHQPVWIKNPP